MRCPRPAVRVANGLTGILVLCISASTAPAQSLTRMADGNVDVGAAILHQPGLPGSGVLTLASQLRYVGLRGSATASGIAARTPEGRFTGQALASASLYSPAPRRLRWEVAATASAFGISDAPSTLSAQLFAREHLSFATGGVFAGAGVAETTREGAKRPAILAQAGGFLRLDPFAADELSGAVAFVRADARPWQSSPASGGATQARTSYGDVYAYWDHDRGRVELVVGAGVRSAIRQVAGAATWGSVSATVWLSPRLGITGSAGRALADVVRGVPTVRYASIALRVGFHDRRGGTSPSTVAPRGGDDRPRLDVTRGEGELRVISVSSPAASTVEIMADFTEWEPVALARDDTHRGVWTLTRPLASGAHRVAVRIDGGEWIVPPNLPRVADEFGGAMGLLTVP